jgi:PAS domain S-box-containing protein
MTLADSIVAILPDAVVVLDDDKHVVEWTGAAPRLFGWSAEEMAGAHIDRRLEPRDANGNPCCFGPPDPHRVLRTVKRLLEQEILAKTKSGRDVWLGVTCTFERDSSRRVVRVVALARDIARRKRIDLAKSETISAVSHELRSPLTSVKGFTSTLLNKWDRLDDETKKHLLFTIDTDADRVTRLIGELLDVSRLEAGRLHLRRQMVHIPQVARRVVERVGPLSSKHTLETDFPEEFPEVYADPDKVQQVLTNLVENAVKYSAGGRVHVSGTFADSAVHITVTDEGEGIPKEHRHHAFSKFFGRIGGSPTGTGLGLYISKGLVEAHGGKIWVDEAPGGGALFGFTLPLGTPRQMD